MKLGLPAGDRTAQRLAMLLWVAAAAIVIAAVGVILPEAKPLSSYWLDDLHWTVAYLAAAGLAWIGVKIAGPKERTARWWFAVGLSANAIGHVSWNIQELLKWNPFPAPSDLFFLCLGPACAMGFWSCLKARLTKSQHWLVALDAAAFSAAVLALTLAFYLPRQGESSAWELAVLAAYPVTLLSAACIGVILILTLRLRMKWGWTIFVLALIGTGLAWMRWNSLALDRAIEFGGWLSLSFSVTTLALGLGAVVWRVESSSNPSWARFCEGALSLLPVLLVVSAAVSVALVWTLSGVSPTMRSSAEMGAAGVLALAVARQSVMLADRNRLLAAEYRLHETEGKFRTLFEMADDAVFILDGPIFIDCNQSTLRLFGCTREEVIGASPLEISPQVQPDGRRSAERVTQIVEAAMAGIPQAFEWRLIRKSDGMPFDAEVHVNRIELDGRTLLGAIVRDITERKNAQEQARLAAERLQLAIRAGKVGIWDLDVASGKLVSDEQISLLYGRGFTKLEDWFRSIHPDDLPQVRDLHEEALHGERKSIETNFRIYREIDGSMRYVRSMGSVLLNESGEPLRIFGVNWDVTEERLREERLSRSLEHEKELARKARAGELAKSEFLAVMSHEIRTPMNGILGFAELLAQDPSLSLKSRDYAEIITTSSEALLRILDDILAFSRLEAGHVEIEKAAFSPRNLLEDIRMLLVPSAHIKGLKLELMIAEDIPRRLYGDAGRLRQILLNLAGNAIKFTTQGSVVLGLCPSRDADKSGRVEFFVRDTGMGILADKLAVIFQPFVQADYSISRSHGGAGLGLTISQRLTKLMGGELRVESEPGKGSLFRVIVPLDVADSEDGETAEDGGDTFNAMFSLKNPLKVLLAEDDKVNRKLAGIILHKLGYEPSMACNGREAVEIFREMRPDFIMMDIQMPEIDGIEATRQIREIERLDHSSPAFIAAYTANISPTERQRCFDVGMNHYLNKPLRPSQLAQALKMAVRRA